MENPEEVLQALDEFQKMRPSEIPRELEEYLCFVAKTGDPVYQWSLIKPLFREKLVRVMTDFYESCPTLDLATSPNIEHFNYDIMKCNLLELLESFANAPFTVQRVCELLTAPRKEYNRVDKFMRAIEKNILVVSTREPGPAARRSENGDSMVNGSIDEDTPTTQQSHEVEMESWVKDCTMDSNVGSVFVPAKKYDSPTNSETTTTATTTPEKITTKDNLPEDCPSIVQEKEDICTKNDIVDSNLISTALTSSVSTNDSLTCPTNGQTLPANSEEIPSIVGDVPEAIMNEDTSSQPSLESENDDNESNRKLQTTFQSKDFDKIDEKSPCQDEQKKNTDETVVAHAELENNQEKKSEIIEHNEKIGKQEGESEHSDNIDETAISADESILEKRPRLDDVITTAAVESEIPKESNLSVITTPKEEIKEEVSVKEEEKKEINSDEPVEEIKKDIISKPIESETDPIVTESPSSNISEVLPTEGESKTEEVTQEITTEASKPIIEEPPFEEEKTQSSEKTEQESSSIVIEEAMDDDVKSASGLIPDPIPIIEEPKDEPIVQIAAVQNLEFSDSTKTEITESATLDSSENVEATIINTEMTETVENKLESSISIDDVQETNSEEMEKVEPAESMEVDGEDSSSVLLQQDEPMEEESPDQTRS